MNLREIQSHMLGAILEPLTDDERMRPRTRDGRSLVELTAQLIKPNDRLTAFERLEIYSRQYWFRVLDALADDFPGVEAIVGRKRFAQLLRAYLADCPSRSYTLRDLGSRFESWLRRHPLWIEPRAALALDMVRLEWAEIEAFDAAERPVFGPKDLADVDDVKLQLQPHVRLLRLRYPVDDLLIAIKRGDAGIEDTLREIDGVNDFLNVEDENPQDIYIAVYRLDFAIYFKRLDAQAFEILRSLQKLRSVSVAIELAFPQGVTDLDIVTHIWNWFASWVRLGWFCRPNSATTDLNI